MPKNIAIIGAGGLGANLAMLLLDQGHNVFLIDADSADEKFFKRFSAFTGSFILNIGRSKVEVIKSVAINRGYEYKIRIKSVMVTPEFDYKLFELYDLIVIAVDTIIGRQMIELNLKKSGLTNFIHIGLNLNSISIFKTATNLLGEDNPNAQTSYDRVPDARTYLTACLEVLDLIDPTTIQIYKE
jgi:glycerol-3-phosphate dehydrogenase